MVKAAVLTEVGRPLEIRDDVEVEAPRADEVRIRFGASGVCHSDLHMLDGTQAPRLPIVLGHEGAGIIEAIGEGVTSVAVGDHVVVSWVPQCGACYFCTRGQGQLCKKAGPSMASGGLLDGTTRFTVDGAPLHQMAATGSFAEVAVIPASGAVKIDDDVPMPVAALLGCGVLTGVGAALNTADIRPGDTVAVVGCGGVGLNVIQGARIAGAGRIIAVDQNETKLELARTMGATDVIDARNADAVAEVKALTDRRGADVAFEVIGLQQTIDQVVAMTRRGGQAVLVGVPKADVVLHLGAFAGVVYAAKSIIGCWYGSSNTHEDIPKLVALYKAGDLLLDELVSREIALEEVNEAFEVMATGEVARSVIVY